MWGPGNCPIDPCKQAHAGFTSQCILFPTVGCVSCLRFSGYRSLEHARRSYLHCRFACFGGVVLQSRVAPSDVLLRRYAGCSMMFGTRGVRRGANMPIPAGAVFGPRVRVSFFPRWAQGRHGWGRASVYGMRSRSAFAAQSLTRRHPTSHVSGAIQSASARWWVRSARGPLRWRPDAIYGSWCKRLRTSAAASMGADTTLLFARGRDARSRGWVGRRGALVNGPAR